MSKTNKKLNQIVLETAIGVSTLPQSNNNKSDSQKTLRDKANELLELSSLLSYPMYGDFKSNVGQKRTTCTKSKEEIESIITKSKTSQGLSKFIYGDKVIWALNQKVADKKAVKKGYL